ncbi:peptidoglycan-binding protein [Streptomyces sp. AS02]|uniref:peptidoglycan-binding protein n=1 Tax=Streptomyces sp. AS02 TaxID=2938946 RepID=UPI0020209DFD|nr:peptidoglycan-binding protein [Streptomyces sp. AS02]MCL8016961.1 peptidoglycan-binding protein [Streptomyces sp. AS02]
MPDPTTPQDEPTAARKSKTSAPEPAPSEVTTPASGDDARYEPYPGAVFFHGGRHSDIVTAMARRLESEGCTDGRYLGPDWTNAHRDAFAAWQRQLRPKGAGDISGIPDDTAWERLQVPRVTPLPQES